MSEQENEMEYNENQASLGDLPSLGQWLSESFTLFGKTWLTQLLLLLSAVTASGLSLVLVLAAVGAAFAALHGPAAVFGLIQPDNFTLFIGKPLNALIAGALLLLALFVSIRLFIWFFKAMHHLGLDPRLSYSAALAKGGQSGLGFLLLLIITQVLVQLGMLLLIIPGIAAMVYFSMAAWLYCDENKGIFASLRASAALVKGRFWAVLARGLLLGFIYLLISMIPLVGLAATGLAMAAWGLLFHQLRGSQIPNVNLPLEDAEVPSLAKADRRNQPRENLSPFGAVHGEGEETLEDEELPTAQSMGLASLPPQLAKPSSKSLEEVLPQETQEIPVASKKSGALRWLKIALLLLVIAALVSLAALQGWKYLNQGRASTVKAAVPQAIKDKKTLPPEPFNEIWMRGQGHLKALAGDGLGNVAVLDSRGGKILRFAYDGEAKKSLVDPQDRLKTAESLAVDEKGFIYVSLGSRQISVGGKKGRDLVLQFSPAGRWVKQFIGSGRDDRQGHSGALATDGLGHVYVYDSLARSIQIFNLKGKLLGRLEQETRAKKSSKQDYYSALAASPEGVLYALHKGKKVIDRFSVEGGFLGSVSSPASVKKFDPLSIAADWEGNLWVGTKNSRRLFRFSTKGQLLETLKMSAGVGALQAVYVDPWGGLYAAASQKQRLLVLRGE